MAAIKGGRLFTFGCSLTRYHWPTWADILGKSYHEFYNWANRGAGNQQILERFSECIASQTLTSDDTLIVQWTDIHRFDQHTWDPALPESWYPGGNIFTDTGADPMKGFIMNKLWNEKSFELHSLNFIHAGVALARTTKCRVIMMFANDLRPEIKQFPGYNKIFMNNYWVDQDLYGYVVQKHDMRLSFVGARMGDLGTEPTMDYHPTPMMYYHFLQERIAPRINLQIDRKFAEKMQKALEQTSHYTKIGDAIRDAGYDPNKHYVRGY